MLLDSILNMTPVVGTVWKWVKGLAVSRVGMFLTMKGILFFLAFKYLPKLFGMFYQWIYNVGSQSFSSLDLTAITGFSWPEISGFAAWAFLALKLDTVITILISGAVVRLGLRPLPFFR